MMNNLEYAHSIYLTGKLTSDLSSLPPRIATNIRSFKSVHPDVKHQLFLDDGLRTFIKEKFDNDVLLAYDNLIPLAYKADLGRYCLLYEYGGIYSDVSLHFYRPLPTHILKNRSMLLFRDGFSHAPWIVSNALLLTKSKLPLFEYLINKIVQHTRTDYYGHNALCPTGPNLLGRSIAQQLDMKDFFTGEASRSNKNPNTFSFAYILPDGEVCAISIKTGAGLQSLGSPTHDDYNEHYARKRIYKSFERG